MQPHLTLARGTKTFLLVGYPDRYHIITVNRNLTEETEAQVLTGNWSGAALDEKGLTRMTIAKQTLRGVAVGGCDAGDALVLYVGDKKLKYILSDDYAQEDIDSLFHGVKRFQPPKASKAASPDWRTPMQREEVRKILKPVGIALNGAGAVCFIGASISGRHHAVWVMMTLLVMLVSLIVYVVFSQYFSLMGRKAYERSRQNAKVLHLDFAIVCPGFALVLRTLRDFYFPDWLPLLLGGVAAGTVCTVALYFFAREMRENKSLLVVTALLAVYFCWGAVGQVNHLANFQADAPRVCTVTETEHGNGKNSSASCTVALDSGEEIELPISRAEYNNIQPGEAVKVYIGFGALGIEYAYLVEVDQ